MRLSLFWKVYLTILGSLAAVAVTVALAAHFGSSPENDWGGWRDRLLVAMFPAGDGPEELATTVERIHAGTGADIAIFARDGSPIVAAGAPIAAEALDTRRWGRGDRGKLHIFALPGGRVLAAGFEAPFQPQRTRFVIFLALVATAIGIAAWPIVSHLTRRLERLRHGVEAFGTGALVTRVPVEGRDEIAAVAQSFNLAAGEIERLVASHRALLANASHELRSPLTRLRMAVDLLPENADAARRAEIVRSLGEIDELVEEILLASRLDHVRELGNTEPLDLLALAAEEAALHGLSVEGESVCIEGDRRLLTRLVRNLIVNAGRHGAPPIAIEIARVGDHARLRVSDHGPGVPEAERARVFEAFYRPAGHAESAGGWGLGLALVRRIAEHHGGTASCEAGTDRGASFVVDLPAVVAVS
ncbi:MAG: sensor histidine kinase [Rhizobiaceae bacterium]